eukprot:CAMPEP_0113698144 /NCGR_PEP_ID=MMETSP0038_2-20120614/22539_1 /TAXON_ID=2898 /ORGANISM="Cryptomonas paramecium" /LENGTH=140 /DNA_ID=CAMNT_0000621259 /DNA_START=39 /DNA_END=461 /DNA_ORIENTATION=- /assembly_acc=CAM_ASM_000170
MTESLHMLVLRSVVDAVKSKIQETEKMSSDLKRLVFPQGSGKDEAAAQKIRTANPASAAKKSESFQIFIKFMASKSLTLNVETTETIASVKSKIAERTGAPEFQQRLCFLGKTMEDSCTLADYNITKDSSLHFIIHLHGG